MEGRLVRDHEQEDHEQKSDPDSRPTCPVNRLPAAGQRHDERHAPPLFIRGEELHGQQQQQRDYHHQQLRLNGHTIDHVVVACVPRHRQDGEEHEDEEEEVGREIRQVFKIVSCFVAVRRPSHDGATDPSEMFETI